jgi:hypothetical protein
LSPRVPSKGVFEILEGLAVDEEAVVVIVVDGVGLAVWRPELAVRAGLG